MFPTQLMIVRRSKKGIIRSVFLTEENSDYCSSVTDLFNSSKGKRREEIEEELKTLELKVQNPKIIRGLSLLMFRLSKLDRPSSLDSALVRKTIFSISVNPPLSAEERSDVLGKAARIINSSSEEIEDAMYADKESNLLLTSPFQISPDMLAKIFNREQIETVILKSLWVEISSDGNINRIIRRARSLGLLYELRDGEEMRTIRVNGPVSIFEKSQRYGGRLALFVRFVTGMEDWELNASIYLKGAGESREKMEYLYHLDHSVSELIDSGAPASEQLPPFVDPNPLPLETEEKKIIPDYSIAIKDESIAIFVSAPKYYEEDFTLAERLESEGIKAEAFCLLEEKEKCPKGAICFKEKVDWWVVRDYLVQKYGEKGNVGRIDLPVTSSPVKGETSISDKVASHLRSLYPDSQAMVEYLEFMGLPVAEVLEKLGFKIKWSGLRLIVL